MSSNLIKKTQGEKIFDFFLYTIFILFSFTIIYPFWDTLLLSFSKASEASSLGIHLWIDEWSLDSYRYLFSDNRVLVAYGNTIFRTTIGTALTTCVTILCAYPLSKKDLPGRNWFTSIFIFTMFFNGGMIPNFLLVRSLGLIDNRAVLILPILMNVYYMVIMRNFLMSLDSALEESAFIDGAGYLTILTKIIIPLSKPVIAVIVMWTAVYHWNLWFDALIYIRSDSKIVLQLLLRRMLKLTEAESRQLELFVSEQSAPVVSASIRAGIVIVTIGPIILLYPFLQKYFIKGMMIGSLKG